MSRSIWNLGEHSGYPGADLDHGNITCPFCESVDNFAIDHRAVKKKPDNSKTIVFDTLKCGHCTGFVLVVWSARSSAYNPIHNFIVIPQSQRLKSAPKHWPPEVGRFWVQAHRSLDDENWDAATVMARSAVQAALRLQGATGSNLKQEIDDLANKGLLPPLMKDWSHEVRELGNDSAHPAPGSIDLAPPDARDIVKFVDFMCIYLYDLPNDIAVYRSRKQQT